MARVFRNRVFFRVNERGGGDLAGVLDMLRYDNARVVTWSSPYGDEPRWSVTFDTERQVTAERWASFGLRVVDAE